LPKNIKLTIEYDGSDFHGWQIQPNLRTVQGIMETALKSMTQEMIRLTASGRTDTGVHALEQIVNFHYSGHLKPQIFQRGLNALLPEDIRVINAEQVDGHFDARRSAVSRTYRYLLSKQERAIGRQYAWFPPFQYKLQSMMEASEFLTGSHDWKAFSRPTGDQDTISTVYHVDWKETWENIAFEITAIRFFHSMIRLIIGTLLDVGRGRVSPQQFKDILDSRDLSRASPKAPSCGLYLVHVNYKGETI
jgi:tRNA pseudouridine38-40 synthase